MKLFKVISHPYTLIICFLLIIISGEHLGGFYAVYLLIGLPFAAVHSLLALAGIIALLISHNKLTHSKHVGSILNLIGLLLLFASLYFFFTLDKNHYNWGSFEQTIPVLTMIVTSCVALCFLLRSFLIKLPPGRMTVSN